jgi:hypothetical protein
MNPFVDNDAPAFGLRQSAGAFCSERTDVARFLSSAILRPFFKAAEGCRSPSQQAIKSGRAKIGWLNRPELES